LAAAVAASGSTDLAHRPAVAPQPISRLARLRKHVLARLSAFAFIALILLPFTQPFPTYQLDPAHGQPFDALPKEYKSKLEVDGGMLVPALSSAAIPGVSQIIVRPILVIDVLVQPPLHHLVLRL
jgi:hypothetical protein